MIIYTKDILNPVVMPDGKIQFRRTSCLPAVILLPVILSLFAFGLFLLKNGSVNAIAYATLIGSVICALICLRWFWAVEVLVIDKTRGTAKYNRNKPPIRTTIEAPLSEVRLILNHSRFMSRYGVVDLCSNNILIRDQKMIIFAKDATFLCNADKCMNKAQEHMEIVSRTLGIPYTRERTA